MAGTLEMICWCGAHYSAREADVARGWGLSCSKSHAAIRRNYGKPRAVRADGVKLSRVRKKNRGANRLTPDTRQYVHINGNGIDSRKVSKSERDIIQHESDMRSAGHMMDSGYFGHGQS